MVRPSSFEHALANICVNVRYWPIAAAGLVIDWVTGIDPKRTLLAAAMLNEITHYGWGRI